MDKSCVHDFIEQDTELSMDYETYINNNRKDCHSDYWIYNHKSDEEVSWDYLEEKLSKGFALEKSDFLTEFNNKKTDLFIYKNRIRNIFKDLLFLK